MHLHVLTLSLVQVVMHGTRDEKPTYISLLNLLPQFSFDSSDLAYTKLN